MSPSGNLDWVWYGAGIVLALLGLALAYWSLLHDRARGRRRCPKCWYDMSSPGPDPLTCPECGRTVKREKKLFKTRRRWRWAMVACLLAIGAISLYLTPKVWRDGWSAIIPTTFLIVAFPLYEDGFYEDSWVREILEIDVIPDPWQIFLYETLTDRCSSVEYEFTTWQWWLLMKIILPKQQSMAQKYERELNAIAKFDYLSDYSETELIHYNSMRNPYSPITEWAYGPWYFYPVHQLNMLEEYAAAQPGVVIIEPHDRWPVNMPISWRLLFTSLMDEYLASETEITISSHLIDGSRPEWLPQNVLLKSPYDSIYMKRVPFGEDMIHGPPEGIHHVVFDIELSITMYLGKEEEQLIPYQSFSYDTTLQVRGEIDDILEPIHDTTLDESLKNRIINVDIIDYKEEPEAQEDYYLRFYTMMDTSDLIRDITFEPRIELRQDENVVAELQGSCSSGEYGYVYFHFKLPDRSHVIWQDTLKESRWSIRIYGSGRDAIRSIEFGPYWAGQFEIPVNWPAVLRGEDVTIKLKGG